MTLRIAIVIALCVTSAHARAATLSVALRPVGEVSSLALTLRATPAEGGDAIIRDVVDASDVELDVRPGHWLIEIDSERWWHQPQYVFVGDDPASVTASLWPAAIVKGTVEAKGAAQTPSDVRLQFLSADDRSGFPSAEVICNVDRGSFACRVPAGALDLRLRSPGFVPHYFWDKTVDANKATSLGRSVLVKGASLTGKVVAGAGVEVSPDAIDVVAMPANARSMLPPNQARLGRFTAKAGKRGLFHFDGLPPGNYIVRASSRGVQSDELSVVVVADAIAALHEPLRLELPTSLRVNVTPPLDPWGERWRVSLERSSATGEMEITARRAIAAGAWTSPPLRSGHYTISIESERGGTWASQEIDLPKDSPVVDVTLQPLAVRGRVTLGERALECKLRFQSVKHAISIEVPTKDDGTFDTFVPRITDNTWRVIVDSQEPRIKHTLREVEIAEAPLDIRVPATVLSGIVLDEQGNPTDAHVNVTSELQGLVQVSTRDDGTFDVYGLPAGRYEVQAAGFLAESAVEKIEIAEDLAPDALQLVVTAQKKVRGWVLSGGAPIAAAELVVAATDVPQQLVTSDHTDARGEFGATAPPAAREADIAVYAPGFDFKMFHLAIPNDPFPIELSQRGGTIVIPLPVRDMQPYLQHGGATHYVGQHQMPDLPFVVKNGQAIIGPMEPGAYSLCMIRHAELPLLRSGALDRSQRCVEGFLPPHGELTFAR